MDMLLFILPPDDNYIMSRWQEISLDQTRGIDCKPTALEKIAIFNLIWKEKSKQIYTEIDKERTLQFLAKEGTSLTGQSYRFNQMRVMCVNH